MLIKWEVLEEEMKVKGFNSKICKVFKAVVLVVKIAVVFNKYRIIVRFMVVLHITTNNTHKEDYLRRIKWFNSLITNKTKKLLHLMILTFSHLQLQINKILIMTLNYSNNWNPTNRNNRGYNCQDSRHKGNRIYNMDKSIILRSNKELKRNLKEIMIRRLFSILVMSTNQQVRIE